MEPRVFQGAVRAFQRLKDLNPRDGPRTNFNERRQTFRGCEGAG